MTQALFPFGAVSTPRPPRRPTQECKVFVLGVYPSALHVRWDPPAWAREFPGVVPIGALAVADEPTVFWDGRSPSPLELVEAWKSEVQFKSGDAEGQWGHVRAAGNGSSGSAVTKRVLTPLGVTPAQVWFSDVINTFFVKAGTKDTPGQVDVVRKSYLPVAAKLGLPTPTLPLRPSVEELVKRANAEHAERIRSEILESRASTVVTLGEESRRVFGAIVDGAEGPPLTSLVGAAFAGEARKNYGALGSFKLGASTFGWRALVHPGQRKPAWRALHDDWVKRSSGKNLHVDAMDPP